MPKSVLASPFFITFGKDLECSDMKKVYVVLAEGFELMEATTPIDVLKRCGAEVITVAVQRVSPKKEEEGKKTLNNLWVTASNGVKIEADIEIAELQELRKALADMVILPGGYPGYENLGKSDYVKALLKKHELEQRYIAAICGAPAALAAHNIAKGSKITCHSSVKEIVCGEYNCTENPIEIDGKLITGKGAGRSLEFAFTCAEALYPKEKIAEVKKKMEL